MPSQSFVLKMADYAQASSRPDFPQVRPIYTSNTINFWKQRVYKKWRKRKCITRESNAGPIDGNDRGYHYPSNAVGWFRNASSRTRTSDHDLLLEFHPHHESRSTLLFIFNVFLFLFHAVLGRDRSRWRSSALYKPCVSSSHLGHRPCFNHWYSFPPQSITRFNFLFRSRQRTRYHHTSIHQAGKRRYHPSR